MVTVTIPGPLTVQETVRVSPGFSQPISVSRRGPVGATGAPGAPPAPAGPRRESEIGWLKPGETRTVSWTVSGPGMVTVTIGSTRGGVDTRSLTLR